MSRKYKILDQNRLYFVSYAVVGWVDLFIRDEYRDIVLDSLKYCCNNKGLEVYAWCIMTSHVHLIIGTNGRPMEDILRDHKRHTSVALLEAIRKHPQESRKEWILNHFATAASVNSNNSAYQLWQQHNKPIELYTRDVIHKYLDYLHNNPVVAGFVDMAEAWRYSSARDYNNNSGLLKELIMIDTAIWG